MTKDVRHQGETAFTKATLADEMFAALEPIMLTGDNEALLVFRPLDESKFWHHWCERYARIHNAQPDAACHHPVADRECSLPAGHEGDHA